jgi:hypothetical protein
MNGADLQDEGIRSPATYPLSPLWLALFFLPLLPFPVRARASPPWPPSIPAVARLPALHWRAQELRRASLATPVRGIEPVRSQPPAPSLSSLQVPRTAAAQFAASGDPRPCWPAGDLEGEPSPPRPCPPSLRSLCFAACYGRPAPRAVRACRHGRVLPSTRQRWPGLA